MYASLKKIAKSLLPTGLMYALEPTIRATVALFYSGKNVYCPLCEHSFSHFIQLRPNTPDSDLLCPYCAAIQRKRLIWLYLDREVKIREGKHRILHFSPHRYFAKKLSSLPNVTYTSTDYESTRADRNWDITNIPEADNSYDLILCYHVLEHIGDDRKAMSELFRILRPGGKALLQVPHREEPTDEDPTITDPKIRLQRFGQDDHVRWYNRTDFVQRLTAAGFNMTELKYAQQLDNSEIDRFKLRKNEIIFVGEKR